MEKQKVDLGFPLGGEVRAAPYRTQNADATPDALNVRPYDTIEGRARGGSRPGLSRFAPTAGSTPVRMLQSVNVQTNDKYDFWEDTFDYEDASHVTDLDDFELSAPTRVGVLPSFERGYWYAPGDSDNNAGIATSVVVTAPSTFNASQAFRYGIHVSPESQSHVGRYYLMFGMASSPSFDNCIYAELQIQNGFYSASAAPISGGTPGAAIATGTNSSATGGLDGWFEVEVSGTALSLWWRGEQVCSGTMGSAISSSSTGLAFGMAPDLASPITDRTVVSRVRLQYTRAAAYELLRPRLVYSQAGKVYKDSYIAKFAESSATSGGTKSLASDRQIMAAERGGKLFIADHGEPVAYGTDGVISGNTSFDSATYSNWSTTLTGYNKADHIISLPPQGTTTTFNDTNGNRISALVQCRIEVTHGTITLASTTGLSFTLGNGYRNEKMEFAGLPAAIATALDGMTYRPEASYVGAYKLYVSRLVDNQIVETSENSLSSAGSNVTFSTGGGNLIPLPESSSLPYSIRLSVNNGTLALSSTSGLTFITGANSSASMLFTGTPTNVNAAMNGMVFTPDANYGGAYTLTYERLVNWKVVESFQHYGYVGQYRVPQHEITTIASGALTIPSTGNGSGLTFRIERCPKVYDPLTDTLIRWVAKDGYVPIGCSMLTRYRDRMVMAGDPLDPNEYYMSRQGDPYDWLYTDVDVGAAIRGSNSEAGRIGDPITALMAFNDDYMFFGCRSSLWLLRGDIAAGGKVASISRTVGVLDRQSWCTGPNGELIWMSRDGLWMSNPECMTCTPIAISRDVLPQELINVNPQLFTVTLGFDLRLRGAVISLTPRSSTAAMPESVRHWFLNWTTKSLYPIAFAEKGQNPVCALAYSGLSAEDSCVLFGGVGGGVYRFSDDSWSDDGSNFDSYIKLGPIMVGDGIKDGMVCQLRGTLASESGNVTWELYQGNSPEQAVEATTAFETGTLTTDQRQMSYPRMRCESAIVKLVGTPGVPWGFESISVVVAKLGMARADR